MADAPGFDSVLGLLDHYARVSGATRLVAYLHPDTVTADVLLAFAERRVRWVEFPLGIRDQITVAEDLGPEHDPSQDPRA